jgi:hypothetical protein
LPGIESIPWSLFSGEFTLGLKIRICSARKGSSNRLQISILGSRLLMELSAAFKRDGHVPWAGYTRTVAAGTKDGMRNRVLEHQSAKRMAQQHAMMIRLIRPSSG